MSASSNPSPRLPPRWFIRSFWAAHRAIYRLSGGRFGLRRATDSRWGMLALTTTGRRTGRQRTAIVGYLEDGPSLVLLAMNGWAEPAPSWWLNLEAQPNARVKTPDGTRDVAARKTEGDERARLWAMWKSVDTEYDAYAAMRSRETPVVVLEPRATLEPANP